VNISGEDAKTGMPAEEVRDFVDGLAKYDKIKVVGLMGMAAETDDAETARKRFASLAALRDEIRALNRDPDVHGILLQLPLPAGLEEDPLLGEIDPAKDVDGFHPVNVGRLCLGLPGFVPATPLGIVRLLQHHEVPVPGRRVVILGRSRLVGRPLANLLSSRGEIGNATVTLCHTQTRDLPAVAREAEILIAAVGRPRFVTREMVTGGAVVVDVGVHREPDPAREGATRLCGDVDFDAVAPHVAAISPVPGGVGLMTVACLLENTVRAAELAAGRET